MSEAFIFNLISLTHPIKSDHSPQGIFLTFSTSAKFFTMSIHDVLVKYLSRLFLLLSFLLLSIWSMGQTVYVTNTGSKYHRGGCQYLSKSKISTSLDSALT